MLLTAAETTILNAVTAHSDLRNGVKRSSLSHQETVLKSGIASEEYRRFVGDRGLQVNWMFRVLEDLSGGDVRAPRNYLFPDNAVTCVREYVDAVFEDACHGLVTNGFIEGFPGVIEDGKVISPWNPEVLKVVRWFVDNLTVLGTWLIYQRVFDAIQDCVSTELCSWSAGFEKGDHDPRNIARDAFKQAMQILYDDIKEL